MWFNRTLGTILLICGFGLVAISVYIQTQVIEGRGKIADAQQTVDVSKTAFSFNKNTKPVGDTLTQPVQGQLDQKSQMADEYEKIASQAKIWGIVVFGVGALLLIFSFIRGPKSKK